MRWEKVSRCRCAGTGIKPSASCCSRKRCVNPDSSHVKSQCRTVLATSNAIIQLLNKEEDMMKEAYAPSIECEEPCEGRLSRTVLWEGEGETPSLYSTSVPTVIRSWKKPEKRVLTYFAKYLNILCHLSLDTLPFMSTYFFEAVLRQNQGIYY